MYQQPPPSAYHQRRASTAAATDASSFFNSSTNPATRRAPKAETSPNVAPSQPLQPQNFRVRSLSHGSANANINVTNANATPNSFGGRQSVETLSTITQHRSISGPPGNGNGSGNPKNPIHHHTPGNHASVPATIQVTNKNKTRVTKNANTSTGASASRFFNQPTHTSASEPPQHDFDSPALNTAVSLFSKTASALYQTTTAVADAAGDVGAHVGALRNDFVKMAAPVVAPPPVVPATRNNANVSSSALFGSKHSDGGKGNTLGISGAAPSLPRSMGTPSRTSGMSSQTTTAISNTNAFAAPAPAPALVAPSPARSAAEMFGQSVSVPPVRSASPVPMRAPSPAQTPVVHTAVTASSLFGGQAANVPPIRSASPTPTRVPLPAPAVNTTAASLFGQSVNAPLVRSVSPVPMRAPSPAPAPAPAVNATAASLFGGQKPNVPPIRSAPPIPMRVPLPAPVPATALNTTAASLFGQKTVEPLVRSASPTPMRVPFAAPAANATAASLFSDQSTNTPPIVSASLAPAKKATVANLFVQTTHVPPAASASPARARSPSTAPPPVIKNASKLFGQTVDMNMSVKDVNGSDLNNSAGGGNAVEMFGQSAPPVMPPVHLRDGTQTQSAAGLFGQAPAVANGKVKPAVGPVPAQVFVKETMPKDAVVEQTVSLSAPPTSPHDQSAPTGSAGNAFDQPPPKSMNEPPKTKTVSNLFQKPPVSTLKKASTPNRPGPEAVIKPSPTTRSTPKSMRIQVKPLPQFSKPRLPSPVSRRPRISATPERKPLSLPLPTKKSLPLPQPKRKSSFTESLLSKKDVVKAKVDGKSVTSTGSGSARSGNSTSGGMFRIPPPIQISASPTSRRRWNTTEETMSPLKSPTSPWSGVDAIKQSVSESTHVESSGKVNSDVKPADEKIEEALVISEVRSLKENKSSPEKDLSLVDSQNTAAIETLTSTVPGNTTIESKAVEFQPSPPPTLAALPPLPEGWIELTTPDSGMKYYLNAATRITTWDRPLPSDFAPPSPPPARLETNTLEPENGTNVQNQGMIDTDSSISVQQQKKTATEVAEEFVTPIVSNALEKHKVIATEKSQVSTVPEINNKLPIVEDHQVQHTLSEDFVHVLNDGDNQGISTDEDPSSLAVEESESVSHTNRTIEAEGAWVELVDQATGVPYFYNKVQNITAWDRPSSLIAKYEENESKALDVVVSSPKQLEREISLKSLPKQEETGLKLSESNPTDESCLDDEVMRMRKDLLNFTDVVDHLEDSQEPISSQTEPVDTNIGLPHGWIEMIDEPSGQPYFFNSISSTTQWERPQIESKSDVSEEILQDEDAVVEHPSAKSETSLGVPTQSDAENNSILKTISTDAQDTKFNTGEEDDEEEKMDSSGLPPHWLALVDESSGVTYYYNKVEGTTQWSRPEYPSLDAENSNVLKSDSVEPSTETFGENVNCHGTNGAENLTVGAKNPPVVENMEVCVDNSSPSADETISDLMPGWIEMIDDSSGQPYYLNEVDNTTQWEKPKLHDETNISIALDEGKGDNEVEEVQVNAPIHAHNCSTNQSENDIAGKLQNDNVEAESLAEETNSLPAEWTEMIDDSSGQKYYYNEIENITQWEKPQRVIKPISPSLKVAGADLHESPGFPIDPDVVAEEANSIEMDESKNEHLDAVVDSTGEDLSSEKAPTGWKEMEDKSSGQIQYYDEPENITQWEKPESAAKDAEAPNTIGIKDVQQNDDFSAHQNKKPSETIDGSIINEDLWKVAQMVPGETGTPSLPAGWVVITDEVSGNVYYYNETENITQWEKPAFAGKEEDILSLEPRPAEALSTAGDSKRDEPKLANKEDDILPPKTQSAEACDTAAGTQWHEQENFPSPEPQRSETFDTAADEMVEAELDFPGCREETAEERLDEDDSIQILPEGWVEMIDQSSGQPYYFNEIENISQWKKPTKLSETEAPVPASLSKTIKKPVDVCSLGTINDASKGDTLNDNEKAPTTNVGSSLPDGWVQMVDSSSGKPYYVNEVKDVTQWEKPEEWKSQQDLPDDTVERRHGSVSIQEEGSQGNEDKVFEVQTKWEAKKVAELEKPASKRIEDEGGKLADASLSSTTNDDGPQAEFLNQNETLTPAEDLTSLPDGWVEIVDPSSGKPYYFNEIKDITQWEKPNKSLPQKYLPSEDAKPIDNIADGEEEDNKKKEEVSELQPGWVEMMDESSGQPYYYNENLNLTQWEKPSQTNNYNGTNEIADVKDKINVSSFKIALNDSQEEWVEVDKVSSGMLQNKSGPASEKEGVNVDDMPPGWAELEDPSSGMKYYFNESTNTTQWDCPEASNPDQVSTSSRNASKTQFRQRPAHAIATFGFGGRLCIMKPQVAESLTFDKSYDSNIKPTLRKGPIEIHRISLLLEDKYLPRSKIGTYKSVPSKPFINCLDEEILSYLEGKSGECNNDDKLLWNLILIAARWKGRLRSADGISNANGPEANVVNLLLRNEVTMSIGPLISTSSTVTSTAGNSCLEDAQKLLLRGNREEAVKCALNGGDHALGLLIASLCGPSTYHTAARYYIQKTLVPGSPLHTATALFANQIQDDDSEDKLLDFWKDRSQSLRETWQYHLATILSNQTRGWRKIVTALGDELLYTRNTNAAHFCYLVSGRPITQPSDPSSRLVLVGCDHRVKKNLALRSRESCEAYLRTEALEWAKRKGNPNAVITTLQPFKLRYALLLADFGFEEIAKMYVESIRKCTGLYPDPNKQSKKALHIYSRDFSESLNIFEDRLCTSLCIPNCNLPAKETSKLGLSSMLSKIVPKKACPKNDELFYDAAVADASFDDANDDSNVSFISAKSSILDMTTNSMATAKSSQSKFGPSNLSANISVPPLMSTVTETIDETALSEKKTGQQAMLQPVQSFSTPVTDKPEVEAKPSLMPVPSLNGTNRPKDLNNKPIQSVAQANPGKHVVAEAPKSAPVVGSTSTEMTTPVDRKPKEEAPASGSSWSVRGWLTKKLNPDATIATEGEAMEAYYDEDLKRWIFPGDDPAEVAKPLAPPPITPMVRDDKTPVGTPTPALDDPLAMMMAPPARSTPKADPLSNLMAPPSRGTPNSALQAPPRIPRSHTAMNASIPSSAQKSPAPAASAPPQFVIFQPKPTDKSEQEKK